MSFQKFAQIAKECLEESVGVSIEITEDTPFKESGIDSVGSLTLMARAEDEANIIIPPVAFASAKTFGDLYKASLV
jgi:acyl carrier protein